MRAALQLTALCGVLCAAMPAWPAPPPGGDVGRLAVEPYLFETGDASVDAELGRLTVSENRARADSPTIEIAFVRLRSTSERPGPPIVYLAGGPGGSGVDAGRGDRFELFDALRQAGDVILLDQRGTGMSTRIEPEECPVSRTLPLDRPLELATYLKLSEELGAACAAFWRERGVDLDAYDTVESAEDLEALRRALQVERLDLLAISYGTHLALAYLRRHPDRVRRAVLAGVEGPDHTVKLPGQFDRQLDKLEAMLSAHATSNAKPGDVRQLVTRVLDGLDREPVTLRQKILEGPDTETTVVVGRREAAQATMQLLQDPGSMVRVPAIYRRLETGDFTDLAGTLMGMRQLDGLEAMPEAMDAASGISLERRRRLVAEDRSTLLGSGLLQANLAVARGLGAPDLGSAYRAPLRSEVPTLFISGELDGRTPVENARELLSGFSRGRHLLVRGGGHGNDLLLATAELQGAIRDHFLGRAVQLQETVATPPDLSAVRERVGLTAAQAARYVGEYERRPREIWRVLHRSTLESLAADGTARFSNAVLQIRWSGDGFSFQPLSETEFYIDFPWFLDYGFRFELDDAGQVTHLVIEPPEGDPIRMPKVH